MNPLVSVIIPVYNVKPYLREALNSVIEQNYKRMEIIIVDDGSTDGSENICDEYISDPRVLVIHQENQGLSGARNTGLSLFKGDYLCFLDPDDAYHPAFIERLLENALSTNSEMVACKYIVQRTTGEISTDNRKITQSFPRLASGTYSREEALRNLVEGDLNVFVWNKLYKGNLWNSIRFPQGHNYEDIDATYQFVDACRTISMIDEVLYFYRDRNGSITHNYSDKNIRDWIQASFRLEEFVLAHHPGIFSDTLVERYEQKSLYAYMGMFAKCSKDRKLQNELREKIIKKGKQLNYWNIRTRASYLLVCCTPSLFRCIYKIYRSCCKY